MGPPTVSRSVADTPEQVYLSWYYLLEDLPVPTGSMRTQDGATEPDHSHRCAIWMSDEGGECVGGAAQASTLFDWMTSPEETSDV